MFLEMHSHTLKNPHRAAILRGIFPGKVSLERLTQLAGNGVLCMADSGDEGDSEDDKEKSGKVYSKEDLERIVTKRLSSKSKELNKLQKQFDEQKSANASLTERLEALENKGKDGAGVEKELQRLTKALKRSEDQIASLTSERDAAVSTAEGIASEFKKQRVSGLVRNALAAQKAHPEAIDDAVAAMLGSCSPEFDDETNELTLTVGGVPFTKPKEAAKRFLESKPFFAQGLPGGSGASGGRGGNGSRPSKEQMDGMSEHALLISGLSSDSSS